MACARERLQHRSVALRIESTHDGHVDEKELLALIGHSFHSVHLATKCGIGYKGRLNSRNAIVTIPTDYNECLRQEVCQSYITPVIHMD